MFALVDGNNFYVSCERAFRPSLRDRAVVVLSNNDGCAIARSNEAKALGVKMGEPWFKIQHLEGLIALSANFALYGDMSDRMMSIAAGLGPYQEIYSIDESFIDCSGVRDIEKRAWVVKERILQWCGLPACIGLGSTKTLAKLANHVAKTAERGKGYRAEFAGVFVIDGNTDEVFAQTDVGEVWGIGRKISKALNEQGIKTIADLVQLPPSTIRAQFNVTLEKTVRELQGECCLELEEVANPKQQIACTRSFGRPQTGLDGLTEAVSSFATRAAEKLRKGRLMASKVMVFAHTSPHRPGAHFAKSTVVPLIRPSSDTMHLVAAACDLPDVE